MVDSVIMQITFSNYDSLNNPYYAGGGAFAIHATAKRLAKKHVVTVLVGSFPGGQDEIRDNVRYKRVGFSVGHPKVDQVIYQLILPWYVLTQSFDVWIESFTPPYSTAFLPWFTKKPVIAVTHLFAGKEMSEKYHLPFEKIQSFGLRQYENIIALSEFLATQVKASGTSAHITIIPNGLDAEVINRKFEKSEQHIFYLGRLDIFHKGLDILLPAYKKIASSTSYKLLLAGNGVESEVKKVKEMISSLGLSDKVELVGRVEDEKKWRLYEQSVFSIFPSRVEGFAIVALEAMASKSPMITSGVEGLRWIPSAAALRVTSFNSEDYATAMIKLLNDPALRKSMGESGHDAIKEYDWDKIVVKYETLLQDVTKDHEK